MPDVSRALLLPDVCVPSDRSLKTLALYWDAIVVPQYVDRLLHNQFDRTSPSPERTDCFRRLAEEGVVVQTARAAPLPPGYDPSKLLGKGMHRLAASVEPLREPAWLLSGDISLDSLTDTEQSQFRRAVESQTAILAREAALLYRNRVRDAFEFSQAENLAPMADSLLPHWASLVDRQARRGPRREGALLSAVIEGFEVDPGTPVDDILRFRRRHRPVMGRFRASVVDLCERLGDDAPPMTLLARARDTVRNRVEPALGDLEAVMKEGRLSFAVKSLVGATALSLAPIAPVRAAESGAHLVGQTVAYRFSRDKLVREHPFGLLHNMRRELHVEPAVGVRNLVSAIEDADAFFVSAIQASPTLLDQFWLTGELATKMASDVADPQPSDA